MRKYKENVGILPGNPGNEVSLFELTGAKYVITGSYYVTGDQIEVSSRLESTETGDVIYSFPALSGHVGQKESLVQEIRERIKGYWAVKRAEDLTTVNPPKYEAYQALMECDAKNADYYCHLKALSLDSTFLLARVYIYYSSLLWWMDSVHEATRIYIRENWDVCTEYEQNYFNFVEKIKQHRYEAAARELDKNISLDSKDLASIHESAHTWLGVNRPEEAVKRYQPIFDQYEVFGSRLSNSMYRNYFDALNRLGRQEEVLELSDEFDEDDYLRMEWDGRSQFVRSLLIAGNQERLEETLNLFREYKIMDNWSFACVYNDLFPSDTSNYFSNDLRQRLRTYTDPVDSWGYIVGTTVRLSNNRSKAQTHYILKEYDRSRGIMEELKEVEWETFISDPLTKRNAWYMKLWVEGLLGASYARLGMHAEALAQVEILESLRPGDPRHTNRVFKGEVPYYQARIYAILGEPELAVQKLQKSMDEGRISEHGSFVQDWDLAGLKDYQPYKDLVNLK
jgi:hypothetical protein